MATIAELEARRREAARLLRKGMTQTQVAQLIGVTRHTVSGWGKALEQDGFRGLRIARLGRKARLNEQQLREAVRTLRKGPRAAGLSDGPWTLSQVASVIQQQFGVSYRRTRITKLLHESGFIPKKRHGWVRRVP